jgi:ABC-2 type transport system ATP-binding protein
MQEVEAICDRVIIIDNGKIKADEKTGKVGIQKTKYQTIEIELETSFPAEKWKQLETITEVLELPGNIYLLATDNITDIRSAIFNFAVENHLTVLSMNRKEKNLEEVFREITSKK